MDPEKLNRNPSGKGRKKKKENKEVRVGERVKWVMGIEEGTCWDEHWVLYGNQFDNKFHILKKILLHLWVGK